MILKELKYKKLLNMRKNVLILKKKTKKKVTFLPLIFCVKADNTSFIVDKLLTCKFNFKTENLVSDLKDFYKSLNITDQIVNKYLGSHPAKTFCQGHDKLLDIIDSSKDLIFEDETIEERKLKFSNKSYHFSAKKTHVDWIIRKNRKTVLEDFKNMVNKDIKYQILVNEEGFVNLQEGDEKEGKTGDEIINMFHNYSWSEIEKTIISDKSVKTNYKINDNEAILLTGKDIASIDKQNAVNTYINNFLPEHMFVNYTNKLDIGIDCIKNYNRDENPFNLLKKTKDIENIDLCDVQEFENNLVTGFYCLIKQTFTRHPIAHNEPDAQNQINELIKTMKSLDIPSNMIYHHLNDKYVKVAQESYKKKLFEQNDFAILEKGCVPRIRQWKYPFKYPLALCDESNKLENYAVINWEFLEGIKNGMPSSESLLKIILSKYIIQNRKETDDKRIKFQLTREDKIKMDRIREKISSKNRDLHYRLRESGLTVKFVLFSKNDVGDLKGDVQQLINDLKQLNKEKCDLIKNYKGKYKNFHTIGLNDNEKKQLNIESNWRKKGQKALYNGIGMFDMENIDDVKEFKDKMTDFCEYLTIPNDLKSVDRYKIVPGKDAKLLMDLKKDHAEHFNNFLKTFSKTRIYHSAELINKLCNFLLIHSGMSTGSDCITLDNLGYNNVLVIIKGGKKIFNTSKSKMFRMVIEQSDELIEFTMSNPENCSWKIIKFNNKKYLLTPWTIFDKEVIMTGQSCLEKTMSYLYGCINEGKEGYNRVKHYMFPILVMLNNKRSTEVLLHNFRYLTNNSMSIFCNMKKLLDGMVGFNYDIIQLYVRSLLPKIIGDFFNKFNELNFKQKKSEEMLELKKDINIEHPWMNGTINTLEQLSNCLYNNSLCTKGGFTAHCEHKLNIEGVLEIFSEFVNNIGEPTKDWKKNVKILHENGMVDLKREFDGERFKVNINRNKKNEIKKKFKEKDFKAEDKARFMEEKSDFCNITSTTFTDKVVEIDEESCCSDASLDSDEEE
eukprot:GHVR01149122.1.p1 GENE.GHVR01149122.1~~GHVR01149122.1.p1  ORF type:complete len:1008 (+),score=195.58 GHVR01149122.1:813-3836(+)